jgi:hypothetical protein
VAVVLRAIAHVGHPAKSVTIGPFDFDCGGPFATHPMLCPILSTALAGAFVRFVGSAEVAAVEIGTQRGGTITAATVISLEVPPVGWSTP